MWDSGGPVRTALLDQEVRGDLRAGGAASQPQGQLEVGEQVEQHLAPPLLAGRRQPPAVRPAQQHGPGPSASALSTSAPRRTPPSNRTRARPATASATAAN